MSSYVYKKGGACPSKECAHYYQRYGHESLRIQAPATIMVANGCDIRIVQEFLRRNDIRILSDMPMLVTYKREKYDKSEANHVRKFQQSHPSYSHIIHE